MKRRYTTRKVVMRCTECGYELLRAKRGPCPRCREGFLTHNQGRVQIPTPDAPGDKSDERAAAQ